LDPFEYLFGLEQFGIKFGLENIATLVARLGHPERAFDSIHIAGTNGKGSVTAMVAAALRAAGHHTARFTSPHLVDLTERFVIDGRPVSRDVLAAAVNRIRLTVDELRSEGALEAHPTFFEVTTAVAFEVFRDAGVRFAVLEVGLGGRLDATNVVMPIATAITSIAFDHQLYLGNTLRDIAIEKAGIIKPHVPVVVGELPADAEEAIAAIARERAAPLVQASVADANDFAVGLAGAHQRINAAVAVRLLRTLGGRGVKISERAIAEGIAQPDWPGRLDERELPDGRRMLLDAAHNPAGAQALASYLKGLGAPRPLVFAAMRDKDIRRMLAELLPTVSALIATRAKTARSADPAAIVDVARSIQPDVSAMAEPSLNAALNAAWQRSPHIVVAGSIFLLGDVLQETHLA
jgi:dihydrofolate synthase/folylpolyglutamate synthase